MREPEKKTKVAAIVLAAGASSRMGRAKQLLEYGGRSLVRHAAEIAYAAACSPVVVVVGAQAELVRAELIGMAARSVENADWREGLASSVRCGIASLPEDVDAAILMPCDQPAVSPALLETMIRTRRETRKPIVACRYGDTVGAPALFSRERFPQLLALRGDAGAHVLLERAGDAVATLDFPDGVFDLDTPEDWERWQARIGAPG
jgi:molybdenum cofactor cytidylyltransferase